MLLTVKTHTVRQMEKLTKINAKCTTQSAEVVDSLTSTKKGLVVCIKVLVEIFHIFKKFLTKTKVTLHIDVFKGSPISFLMIFDLGLDTLE